MFNAELNLKVFQLSFLWLLPARAQGSGFREKLSVLRWSVVEYLCGHLHTDGLV